jgi:hypothetical protein
MFDKSARSHRYCVPMSFFRVSCLKKLAAFFAVLVFAGDIITDSIADTREGHCVSQTSQSDSNHEKTPCPHCSCAVHSGAVVIADFTVRAGSSLDLAAFLPTTDQPAPSRLAASIDHPPQLA